MRLISELCRALWDCRGAVLDWQKRFLAAAVAGLENKAKMVPARTKLAWLYQEADANVTHHSVCG
ncbi:MAG: hypothetical protein GIW98_03365 [Candidatus Eremiobacteraeota bacterium]|nr:hypothetical protein [Candidatus Eremiobacteraeota bacterium]